MKNNMESAMENYVSKLIDLMSKRLDHLEKESEFCAKNLNIVANDKGLLNQTELESFKHLIKKH